MPRSGFHKSLYKMWEMVVNNNYARLIDLLRVVTTLLILTGTGAALHFSEYIRFLGNRIGAARYRSRY
jgi:hypothetical protein